LQDLLFLHHYCYYLGIMTRSYIIILFNNSLMYIDFNFISKSPFFSFTYLYIGYKKYDRQ